MEWIVLPRSPWLWRAWEHEMTQNGAVNALHSVLLKAELKKDNDKTTTARLRLRRQTNHSPTGTITGTFEFLHPCEDICDVHNSIQVNPFDEQIPSSNFFNVSMSIGFQTTSTHNHVGDVSLGRAHV